MKCEHDGCVGIAEYKPNLCKLHSNDRQKLKERRFQRILRKKRRIRQWCAFVSGTHDDIQFLQAEVDIMSSEEGYDMEKELRAFMDYCEDTYKEKRIISWKKEIRDSAGFVLGEQE